MHMLIDTLHPTVRGVLALIGAGLLWGLVIVGPEMIPDASPTAIVGGRFAVLGVVSVVASRGHLRGRDWGRALRHAFAGFVGYYLLLVVGIRLAGAAPAAVVIGVTPVVLGLVGARHDGLDLRALAAPLAVVLAGLVVVHAVDLEAVGGGGAVALVAGLAATAASVAVWTWYAVDNGRHLRASGIGAAEWTSTVGMAAGALSAPLLGHAVVTGGIGEDVLRWLVVAVVLGAGSAWLGTVAWNAASALLPESLLGPLLVIELLITLAYAHMLAGHLPGLVTAAGYVLLVAGTAYSVHRVQSLQRRRRLLTA